MWVYGSAYGQSFKYTVSFGGAEKLKLPGALFLLQAEDFVVKFLLPRKLAPADGDGAYIASVRNKGYPGIFPGPYAWFPLAFFRFCFLSFTNCLEHTSEFQHRWGTRFLQFRLKQAPGSSIRAQSNLSALSPSLR